MRDIADYMLRRIAPGDAEALRSFYNGLGADAIRRFRPLGLEATAKGCAKVVEGNGTTPEQRYDLLALREGRIAGWGFLWDVHTDKPFFGLGVAAEHRGQGLGGRLTDAVLREAHRRSLPLVYLTVVTDNDVAWRLYERKGFVRYDEYVEDSDGLSYFRMVWQAQSQLS